MTTTEAIVTEIPKDDKEAPAMGGGMGGMGGMDYWGSFAGWTIIQWPYFHSKIHNWCNHQEFFLYVNWFGHKASM